MVNIVINDVDIQVPQGELIVEAVKRLGLEIPIFCYHPRMKPVGMCRMCLVEVGFKQPDGSVRKMPKPQAGCTLPASEGMVIYTDTDQVHKDRKGVLEFLLINHPLDCPICDKGGECPLQNNTIEYGPVTSRFKDLKRHAHKAYPLSNHVTLDLERCIQCGRCVRFTEEISGDGDLAFRFRGSNMQPSTFQLTEFESKFSGNTIEICPVGALTNAHYRFRARPWDLETRAGVCLGCSNGCNVWLDHRDGQIVRVNGRTNEDINEEWTCDRGKFGTIVAPDNRRITQPMLRQGNDFVPVSWAVAYQVIQANFTADSAALVGGVVENEGLFMLQKLFRKGFGSSNLDHRWTRFVPGADFRLSDRHPTSIASLETKKTIVVFGTDLADSQPIVYLRVRKAWGNGTHVVVIHTGPAYTDRFATAIRCAEGGLDEAALKLQSALETPSSDPAYADLAELLKAGDFAIVTSNSIYDSNKPLDTLATLQSIATKFGGELNCYAEGANDEGAHQLGVLPDTLPGGQAAPKPGKNTHEILRDCISGEVDALWLVGGDPLALHPNRRLAEDALEAVPFLVVQDASRSEAMAYASLILPMETPTEHAGTYTNCEGRIQFMDQIVGNTADAKPAWRIFSEVLVRLTDERPVISTQDVVAQMATVVPAYQSVKATTMADSGPALKPALPDFVM